MPVLERRETVPLALAIQTWLRPSTARARGSADACAGVGGGGDWGAGGGELANAAGAVGDPEVSGVVEGYGKGEGNGAEASAGVARGGREGAA